jgi:hypothetical protein
MAHQPNVDVRSPRFGRSLEVRAVLVQRELLAALGRTAQETWYRNWYRSRRISPHLEGLRRGQPHPLHTPPGGRRVAPFPI